MAMLHWVDAQVSWVHQQMGVQGCGEHDAVVQEFSWQGAGVHECWQALAVHLLVCTYIIGMLGRRI